MKKDPSFSVEAPAPLLEFLLTKLPELSRNGVKHLLSRRQVLVDGQSQTQFDFALEPGQTVSLLPPSAKPLPFPTIYEDDGLIVVHKPAGLLSVGTDAEKRRTAYRMVSDYLQGRTPKVKPFVVHRLDRDTSGVLLFAKDPALKAALQNGWNTLVKKRAYWAAAEGEDLPDSGVCRSTLRENAVHKVYSDKKGAGKEAVTRYRVLTRGRGYALLDVELDTGRKNQIRAHLSELGHPVAGDRKYGAASDPMGRLGLHARELVLTDPRGGKALSFTAPAPNGFRRLFPTYPF